MHRLFGILLSAFWLKLCAAQNSSAGNIVSSGSPSQSVSTGSLSSAASPAANNSISTRTTPTSGTNLPTSNSSVFDSCDAALQAYSRSSSSYESSVSETITTTYGFTTVWPTRLCSPTVPVSTLCDHPYISQSCQTTNATITTAPTSSVEIITRAASYPTPKPSCEVDPTVCAALFSSWRSATGAYEAGNSPFTTRPSPPACSILPSCESCELGGGRVRLLYWPVTTVFGDFCAHNGSTVTATPTIPGLPNTAVFEGITLTSPTVYVSFSFLQAISPELIKWAQCGPTITNTIVPIPSSADISSRRSYRWGGVWPFDFADLSPGTVPWDAYQGQMMCYGDSAKTLPECKTVWEGEYNPDLVIPTQVKGLAPGGVWQNCIVDGPNRGVLDPPLALGTVGKLTDTPPKETGGGGDDPPQPGPQPPGITPAPTRPGGGNNPPRPTGEPVQLPPGGGPPPPPPTTTTIGGHAVVIDPQNPGLVFVDGRAVPSGGSPTLINGIPVQFGSSGVLSIGSSVATLPTSAQSSAGIGNLIASVIGLGQPAGGGANGQARDSGSSTGAGSRVNIGRGMRLLEPVMGLMALLWSG